MQDKLKIYTLENETLKIDCLNIGAAILNFNIKNPSVKRDIVLGHQKLEDYISNPGNLGVVVGRNANRIEGAKITINDTTYNLEVNHFHNNLHTGSEGLQFQYFDVYEEENKLIFTTKIKHLQDGFPGNLDVKITYTLSNNTFTINYEAVSDRDTIVNLTNHSYFNLNGQDYSNVYEHRLYINSNFYMPNNEFSFPTKEIRASENTPFDFSNKTQLKNTLLNDFPQIKKFNGLDHNFLINDSDNLLIATIQSDDNKVAMNVYSDTSAMHIYTANHFPDESTNAKLGKHYPLHGGIAFETQITPNALNMPWMKNAILKANEKYTSYTSFEINIK